jgi:hypothetical protein
MSTSNQNEKSTAWTGFVFIFVVAIVVCSVIGPIISGLVWVCIWHPFAGYVPKIWGFSRLWLDMPLGYFFGVIFGYYVKASDQYKYLSGDGMAPPPYIEDFIDKHPWTFLAGVFLAIDFIASLFWSFSVGLLIIAFVAILAGIGYGIWRLWSVASFVGRQLWKDFNRS